MAIGGFKLIGIDHSNITKKNIIYLRCDNCGNKFEYETDQYALNFVASPVCPECQFPNDQGTCMEMFIERTANEL